jgi:dethiobiotin synthetase
VNQCTFITGTGTDIGKTYYLCEILKKIIDYRSINITKPIASGINIANLLETDTGKILQAMDKKITVKNFKAITPWYFKEPLSPHLASKTSGTEINFDSLKKYCLGLIADRETFIEGVGGVMTPITSQYTNLDLIKSLPCSVILLTGDYLGAISHVFSAIEVLLMHEVVIEKVIINESLLPSISYDDFKRVIDLNYAGLNVEFMPRNYT